MKKHVALFTGIGMGLLLTAALLPNQNECRILSSLEVTEIRGGAASGGGGGGKNLIIPVGSGQGTQSALAAPIQLSNIPYVSQYTDAFDRSGRSLRYCGIASALMVRAKEVKGSFSFPIPSWRATDPMITIDRDLRNGYYGGYKIDVVENYGLLYLSRLDLPSQQYNKTITVLKSLYKPEWFVNTALDTMRVSNVEPKVLNSGDATIMLWNHIKNNREPAVVIIDSNKTYYVENNKSLQNWEPVLHYIVIAGIAQSGSTRYFLVLDPLFNDQYRKYSESQLQTLMTIPNKTGSAWLYNYASGMGIFNPCYILLAEGV
jgi:hypothetical protein